MSTQNFWLRRFRGLFWVFFLVISLLTSLEVASASGIRLIDNSETVVISTGCQVNEGINSNYVLFRAEGFPSVGLERTTYYAGPMVQPDNWENSSSDPFYAFSLVYPGPAILTAWATWQASDGSSGSTARVTLDLPDCNGSAPPGGNYIGMASTPDGHGYWLAASNGTVKAFGDAGFYGDMAGRSLNKPVVGMASTPDGHGYWLVGGDGGVFSFGDAHFYGSTGNLKLNKPVVGMASTPDGHGYWFCAADGGVFAYGDAHFYGSMGGVRLNKPVVGMATDAKTHGYWLVAADGGIFSFNAPFYGSTGNIRLYRPIVGMEAASDGSGYRFVATDGGVFTFHQSFLSSLGGKDFSAFATSMAATADANGYWVTTSTGTVYPFGDAKDYTAVA